MTECAVVGELAVVTHAATVTTLIRVVGDVLEAVSLVRVIRVAYAATLEAGGNRFSVVARRARRMKGVHPVEIGVQSGGLVQVLVRDTFARLNVAELAILAVAVGRAPALFNALVGVLVASDTSVTRIGAVLAGAADAGLGAVAEQTIVTLGVACARRSRRRRRATRYEDNHTDAQRTDDQRHRRRPESRTGSLHKSDSLSNQSNPNTRLKHFQRRQVLLPRENVEMRCGQQLQPDVYRPGYLVAINYLHIMSTALAEIDSPFRLVGSEEVFCVTFLRRTARGAF